MSNHSGSVKKSTSSLSHPNIRSKSDGGQRPTALDSHPSYDRAGDDTGDNMETLEAFLKRVEDRYLTMTDSELLEDYQLSSPLAEQCEIGDSLFGVVEEGYDALDHSHRWKRGPNGLYSVGEQTFSGEERDSLLEVCPKTQKTYLVMIFAAMLACSERLTEAFRR